jgi:hypothetical protein
LFTFIIIYIVITFYYYCIIQSYFYLVIVKFNHSIIYLVEKMTIFSADLNFSLLALQSFLCILVVVHATFIIAKSQHIYGRCSSYSQISDVKNKSVFMFKAEVQSEEKISQPEYEVCNDYFLLRSRFFTIFRGFAVWYVLTLKSKINTISRLRIRSHYCFVFQSHWQRSRGKYILNFINMHWEHHVLPTNWFK